MTRPLAAGSLSNTEDWQQVAELGLWLLMSAVIGLERKVRQKSGGLVFVHRDAVRGLTTAASVWVTALTCDTLDAVSG